MITILGYQIGMLSFFVFSFLAGAFIFLTAIFGCKDETKAYRYGRGILGFIYVAITLLAFQQLESIESRYMSQLLPLVALLKRPQ